MIPVRPHVRWGGLHDCDSKATSVVQCARCGLVSTHPRPDVGYAEGHAPTDVDRVGNAALSRLRPIQPWLSAGSRVLELGCSTGALVGECLRMGARLSVGVEPCKHTANVGLRSGLDIRASTLEECRFPANSFDVVHAHHVLEHIADLHATLDEVWRITRPGGIFYLTVPRHDSWFARQSEWTGWFLQQHVWHFTKDTLRALVQGHGYRLSRLRCPMQSDGMGSPGLLGDLKQMAKRVVGRLCLGDTVQAIFIKRQEVPR